MRAAGIYISLGMIAVICGCDRGTPKPATPKPTASSQRTSYEYLTPQRLAWTRLAGRVPDPAARLITVHGESDLWQYPMNPFSNPRSQKPQSKWDLTDAIDKQDLARLVPALKELGPANLNRDLWSATTPICIAVAHGKPIAAKAILQAGGDPNLSYHGYSPLVSAVMDDNVAMAQLLLDYHADPNLLSPEGTPLHVAVRRDNLEMIDFLIEHGADPHILNRWNRSAIDEARGRRCSVYLMNAVLDHDVFCLAAQGKADQLTIALKGKPSLVLKRDSDGRTPLHEAARLGWLDAAKVLLQAGSDVNALDEDGCSPLHLACSNGYPDVARQLLEAGAKVNELNRAGKTPTDLAKHFASVREVLKAAGGQSGLVVSSQQVKP